MVPVCRSMRMLPSCLAIIGLVAGALWSEMAPAQGTEIIIDNTDPGAQAASGIWSETSSGTGYYGSNFASAPPNSGSEFRWTPNLAGAEAQYEVYVRYAANWQNLGTDAPYTVVHASGSETVIVDQTQNGGQWVLLGRYSLIQGNYVAIGDALSNDRRPSADAVRLVHVAEPAVSRLNVLFIVIDDLRPELGTYGVSAIRTPNIDALAAQGTRFNRAFAQMAICSPSRTSLMTGLRPDTAGVTDLTTNFRDTVPGVVTLPQYFKNRGYHTEGICKIYHEGLDDAQSWSVPHKDASGHGAPTGPDGKKMPYAAIGGSQANFADYKCADLAIGAIGSSAARQEPFFIAVGFKKPHLPFIAPTAYFSMYDANAIPAAGNPFRAENAPAVAFENRSELGMYSGIPAAPQPLSAGLERNLKRGYYAATSFVDAQVGRVLAALQSAGVGDNTLVVLIGDHGFHLGEQHDWAKHTNFDIGTRVPLIVRMPGVGGNQVTEALAELVDLYPTIIELAGLPVPSRNQRGGYRIEGDSLAAFINSPSATSRRAAFSQWRRDGYSGYSIRTKRYRFTEWVNGNTRMQELYDHNTDPDETRNVVSQPEYAKTVVALQRALSRGGKANLPLNLR